MPEHLLLALLDDPDVSKAGEVDLQAVRHAVIAYIDEKLKTWVIISDARDATPTVAFRRVIHLATVRSLKRETSSLAVLASMFGETESCAVLPLSEQGMSHERIVSFTSGSSQDVEHQDLGTFSSYVGCGPSRKRQSRPISVCSRPPHNAA